MKEVLKKISIPLLLLFSDLFLYFQMIYSEPRIPIKYKLVFLIVCIFSNIGALLLLKLLKKKLSYEKIFLYISLSFGCLYMFFIPAILGTDELPHFLRPYQISVGDVVVKNPDKNGTKIPSNLYSITGGEMGQRYSKEMIFEKVDYNKMSNIWNGDVTSIKYSPIPYIPQIFGFWISRILSLSPLLTLFMVRFCNLLTWILLGYFSIKLLPTKKIFAIVLYTSPAVLSLVSTCSGDTFALALFLFLISYILNLAKTKRRLEKKDYIILSAVSIGISTYKMFYVLYLFLIFLIPVECYKNNKKVKLLFSSSIILLSILLDFGWFFINSMGNEISGGGMSEQISFILHNPLKYSFIFINTYINDIYYYFTNLIGGNEMCYGLVRINQLFIILYSFVFVTSYFCDNANLKLNKQQKILIVLVSLLIFALVSTALYMDRNINETGALKIAGIQSRYFWALIIPLISILPNLKKKIKFEKMVLCSSVILNSIIMVDAIKSLLIRIFV